MACERCELSILLTSDDEIRALNASFRGKDKATDVLSFSQREGDGHLEHSSSLGDVVISVETAQRQAKEAGVECGAELIRLLIHGVLHLVGYDHVGVTAGKAQAMRRKESCLFAELSCLALTENAGKRR